MNDGLNQFGATELLKRKPKLSLYPKAFSDGGLSEIEESRLQETNYSVGAKQVELCL
ncbi:hypothetical protein [Neptuniibacter sp. QD34_54]|uniref:hypothetical protein n=1 Tax=Neptuniibacter sp. QD34_54 TaxID=3398208 RepID=UPI0039F58A2F